jgi:putative DNA primase/helicase
VFIPILREAQIQAEFSDHQAWQRIRGLHPNDACSWRSRTRSRSRRSVRAYVLAGHPDALPSLASFEEWSRLVRSALVWLGRADPCETMEKARGEDPVIAQLNPLLNAWYDTMSSSPKATGEVIEAAETVNAYGNRANGNLYQALLEVAEDRKGGLSSVSLGKYLARHKGRIVNGLKLTVVEDGHAKQALWKVGRV